MKTRPFGPTRHQVSEIGFGSWAIGASWGEVTEPDALAALDEALGTGVTFFDTADVYGNGRAEQLIAKALKTRSTHPYVATKAGRRLSPHTAEGYNLENLRGFVERSLTYLEVDALDLVQLHCPPTETFYRQDTFDALATLALEGKIKAWGVSVEKVEEGLKALEFPGLTSVQIIYNIFRQRPAERFFPLAKEKNVGIIVRVPLASGLLSGKFKRDSAFAADDHRNFNRHGEAFDVGETFAGVPYEVGLEAVEELRPLVPEGATMAQFALRWILMNDAVSVVIPGAKNARQARENSSAAALPAIPADAMATIERLYATHIKPHVHQRW